MSFGGFQRCDSCLLHVFRLRFQRLPYLLEFTLNLGLYGSISKTDMILGLHKLYYLSSSVRVSTSLLSYDFWY